MQRFVYTLCFVLLCVGSARAQNATLSGLITDPNGAVLAKASVDLVNQDTGTSLHAESNDSGVYTLPFVQQGVYNVKVQESGFKTFDRIGFKLDVAQNAHLDFTLQVGSTTENVEVKTGSIEIDTTDATVSTVVDREFVANLPLNGRLVGAQISIQSRSGTNQFHGTALDYLRNSVLDANAWFAHRQGLPKAHEIQNDFGGVIGVSTHPHRTTARFRTWLFRI